MSTSLKCQTHFWRYCRNELTQRGLSGVICLPRFLCSHLRCLSFYKTLISQHFVFTATPALADLQLTTVGSDSVQVDWKVGVAGLRGYWLTWEGQQGSAASQSNSVYLPADSQSTRLTNLPPSARVCVSPIYRTARGDGLCCTAQFHSGKW